MLALAIAARRLTEREARVPTPRTGERDIVVDGVRWRSREVSGQGGETVVYVHGFLSSSATWKKVLAGAAAGRSAIAVDLPGSGFSDRPWPYDYTVGAQALHLWRYLDAREVRRVVLVGNSLGGAVAVIAAAARPDRIAALVLVDSASPRVEIPWQFRLMRSPVAGELEMELLCRPVMAWTLRNRLYDRASRVTEETVSDWWDPVPVPGTRRAALAALRSNRRGYEDVAARIAAPTLVLWGKGDRLLPISAGADLAQEIHGAWFLTLPDAGHVPQEETPAEFARAVADFLRGRLGTSGASR
ncbi:MAG TPA: alpha/beta hydrolase [Thermoanaerobaculia bacterium]|nr:alpha/beta hydrolase [Thermoanaerobaculia bacterium]